MSSRRKFISNVSKSAVLTSVALSPAFGIANELSQPQNFINKDKKLIRVGIIGAENSHALGFARMFNVDKLFPGVELQYIWGETEEFAKKTATAGKIPNIVKDQKEMLGKIDALIVDHRHAKYHLEAATPFVKAGIPSFIDKPFCYSLSEGKKFLKMAREVGTPVTSFSTAAYSEQTFDMKKQIEALGQVNHFVAFGPVDINSQWGGIYFYGIHLVDTLTTIFGEDIKKVRVTRNGNNAVADLAFGNGTIATLILMTQTYSFKYFAESKKGLIEIKSDVKEEKPAKHYVEMVEMFKTGKEPRSHESILYSIAVLEALDKSVKNENWIEVKA